jgi:hypothetical protein
MNTMTRPPFYTETRALARACFNRYACGHRGDLHWDTKGADTQARALLGIECRDAIRHAEKIGNDALAVHYRDILARIPSVRVGDDLPHEGGAFAFLWGMMVDGDAEALTDVAVEPASDGEGGGVTNTMHNGLPKMRGFCAARYMFEHGFATGHGDTTDSLIGELDWQVRELRDGRREMLAALKSAQTALIALIGMDHIKAYRINDGRLEIVQRSTPWLEAWDAMTLVDAAVAKAEGTP